MNRQSTGLPRIEIYVQTENWIFVDDNDSSSFTKTGDPVFMYSVTCKRNEAPAAACARAGGYGSDGYSLF